MHHSSRVFSVFCCAVVSLLAACEFSDTSVDEKPIDRVYIVDQSGKRWDITQAVVRYGFERSGFKFGLGPFTLTPLMSPPAAAPGDSAYPADTDAFSVIGVSRHGAHRAYKLDDLLDVEVVDDTLGGVPLAVVHRPLSNMPSVCSRVLDLDTLTLSASGWVYGSESVLFDYETESMWYRLGGGDALTCIAGAHFEAVLPAVVSAVSPWSTWRAAHPATTFMLRP